MCILSVNNSQHNETYQFCLIYKGAADEEGQGSNAPLNRVSSILNKNKFNNILGNLTENEQKIEELTL